MRQIPFALPVVLGVAVIATPASNQVLAESLLAQSQPTTPATSAITPAAASPSISAAPQTAPAQTPPSELTNLESAVRPAVIWVSTFDPKGNLLRTATGFFISADGKLATTARALEGGANGVVKTADGGIYNISGILTSSKELDLAILQAEVKPRKLLRFLEVDKAGELPVGTTVAVVGSALAGNDGSASQSAIAAEHGHNLELTGTTPASAAGAPVVNDAGTVVGVVATAGEKTTARSSGALASLLSKITADTRSRWLASAEGSPTPRPTPKPRMLYAPAPAFPPGMSQAGVSGTGRFHLTFDAQGNVTNVQIVKSTGNPYFDQSSIQTLRKWKSAPSQGWAVTVPVTFQTR